MWVNRCCGSGFSRDGFLHGRLARHHFFPQWLATLRFTCGKKDPTLPALRPWSQGRWSHAVGRRGTVSVCAHERRAQRKLRYEHRKAGGRGVLRGK